MKIQIASDLHISNWTVDQGPGWWQNIFLPAFRTDADVLILAGDVVSAVPALLNQSRSRLTELGALYRHVVFVPGNHEFWGTGIVDGLQELMKFEHQVPGLNVLHHGKILEIDGKRFHGATMWQPHRGRFYDTARKPFVDAYRIEDFETEASPSFDAFMDHLETNCRPGDIVISHHAPSFDSLDQQWVGHPSNRFFITPEAEPVMKKVEPRLWVHGHVHTPFDYWIGATQVVCNPHGYPGEGVKFNPQLVIDLP